jgi:hypothetical protein
MSGGSRPAPARAMRERAQTDATAGPGGGIRGPLAGTRQAPPSRFGLPECG